MFNQLFLNSIIAGSIYTLIALGFSLIYSTTRFFHFARLVLHFAAAKKDKNDFSGEDVS